VFVSYMRDRDEIRATVWGGSPSPIASIAFRRPSRPLNGSILPIAEHLQRIDGRLNQNFLVGAAVNQLSQTQAYARGDTLWDALLALIPRAIWPEKPITAGSGNLVSRYTGIDFAGVPAWASAR
jgi:hypothetical protein